MTNLTSTAPHIHSALTFDDLVDWGPQPDMIEGQSHSTGRLLFKGPGNSPETGIWVCTPGRWRLSIPRDEFCHFVAGRALCTARRVVRKAHRTDQRTVKRVSVEVCCTRRRSRLSISVSRLAMISSSVWKISWRCRRCWVSSFCSCCW